MNRDRRDVERLLKKLGFVELPQGSTGHAIWQGHGIKFSLAKHERTMSSGVVMQLLRRLEEVGFDRKTVRKELGL